MLKDKRLCHIVGAGDCDIDRLAAWEFKDGDLIIAADGGFDTLEAAGIEPDILLGDFDSIEKRDGLEAAVSEGAIGGRAADPCGSAVGANDGARADDGADTGGAADTGGGSGPVAGDLKVVRLPAKKDYTDMFFAVEEGIAAGCDTFLIWGGTGGRLDHTVANLQLLAFISGKGLEGYLLGEEESITTLSEGFVRFSPSAKGRISVFSHTERSEGVSESGLLYSLSDAILTSKEAIGVSNEFIGMLSEISVKEGILLITWTGDLEDISERGRY